MMASMAQPFTANPASMSAHTGGPHLGHHPGPPPNQGMPGGGQQPVVSMGQQIHAGVTGPGGPHVSQPGPMMGGITQGGGPSVGGPSAHALSHLNPAPPQQMFSQPQSMQQTMANNPQLHQQYMQRQAFASQQRQQQMMFLHHQSQQNGGPQANPGNPGMNQAQFGNQDIRQVQLTEHLQREQLRAQQQQHVQQQQQQQQQQQNQIAQQRMAMQQAASQAGNTQGQPAPQNMRPQPPMHGVPEVQAAALAQQEAQRQANIQAQQQQQQQQAQAAAQLQQQHNQNQQAQLQQQQQAHAQQAAAMMQQPRAQNIPRGFFITKLLHFGIHLSQFSIRNQANNLNYWNVFVDRFFSPIGVLRLGLWCSTDGGSKQYELMKDTVPRYFYTHFKSGVENIQMILKSMDERDLPSGGHYVESQNSFIYWFPNGCQLVTTGKLGATFDASGKLEVLDITTTRHTEYISRSQLQFGTESPDIKHSPTLKKNNQRNAQQRQKQQNHFPAAQTRLPESKLNDWGLTHEVARLLELSEPITVMRDLMQYHQENPHLSPLEALSQLSTELATPPFPQPPTFPPNLHPQNSLPQNFQNPNLALPPGQRTPSLQSTMQFASPASAVHLSLPLSTASPATLNMSPALHNHSLQQQMLQDHNIPPQNQQNLHNQTQFVQTGPSSAAMVASASHQGTNTTGTGSQGTSANTSPNATNKRRRASQVKIEDEGGGEGRVKQSPKVGGGGKRVKA